MGAGIGACDVTIIVVNSGKAVVSFPAAGYHVGAAHAFLHAHFALDIRTYGVASFDIRGVIAVLIGVRAIKVIAFLARYLTCRTVRFWAVHWASLYLLHAFAQSLATIVVEGGAVEVSGTTVFWAKWSAIFFDRVAEGCWGTKAWDCVVVEIKRASDFVWQAWLGAFARAAIYIFLDTLLLSRTDLLVRLVKRICCGIARTKEFILPIAVFVNRAECLAFGIRVTGR